MNRRMSRKINLSHYRNSSKYSRSSSWRIANDLPSSFKYAFQGISFGLRTQRNFRIHLLIGTFAFIFGLWLNLSMIDFAVLVLTIASVIVLELLNTAIEAAVDLSIGNRYHPLAKTAKDCSAASVLVASIGSLVIALFLLLPPFLSRIGF